MRVIFQLFNLLYSELEWTIKCYRICSFVQIIPLKPSIKSMNNESFNFFIVKLIFYRFALHVRLHISVCFVWILKCVSIMFLDIPKIQLFTNIFFAFQGLLTFVIFVMNRQVWSLIQKRLVIKAEIVYECLEKKKKIS